MNSELLCFPLCWQSIHSINPSTHALRKFVYNHDLCTLDTLNTTDQQKLKANSILTRRTCILKMQIFFLINYNALRTKFVLAQTISLIWVIIMPLRLQVE
jgi:hypothetical protein